MDATVYAGNGAANSFTVQTISTQFTPDLLWIKNRTSGSAVHILVDVLRGNNSLSTNNANGDEANGNQALISNGYTVTEAYGAGNIAFNPNLTGYNYVGWVWDAGSSTVTNNSGSISAQVRASTTAGFSVVTYTGAGSGQTVGHGLGVAPKMIIVKWRANATTGEYWAVYHSELGGANKYLSLNTTNAVGTATTIWNNTNPTSTVFSVGADNWTNKSSTTYVAYCWAEIAGFSKFGSYTGNGSADGTFIYTGFRPKYIMMKLTSSAGGTWCIVDTSRNTYNTAQNTLIADGSDAEFSGSSTASAYADIVSNGFKLRTSNGGTNGNGSTYIYMAFAENPFKNANAR
jgi:hypothetical protein